MKLAPFYVACSNCRLCKGAAYQLPPFLFAGSDHPSILVIAQNPGEIDESSHGYWRTKLSVLANTNDPIALKTLYDVDFITSYGHEQYSKIFGDDWLTNGKFMYTNAVRCRTPHNDTPSDEMIQNCMSWTSQLPFTPLIILSGKLARDQFSSMVKKVGLEAWRIVRLTKDSKTSHIMTIPHYAAMRTPKEFTMARELFEVAKEKAGIS